VNVHYQSPVALTRQAIRNRVGGGAKKKMSKNQLEISGEFAAPNAIFQASQAINRALAGYLLARHKSAL
jgi:hypothetical protein